MKILIGTSNQGKIDQYERIFGRYAPEWELTLLSDLDIADETEEDADNLVDNAKKKAQFYGERSNLMTIADDTGLFVDALGGEPGLHAKRWHSGTEKDRSAKILERMRDVPEEKRTCSYRGAIAVYDPVRREFFTSETVEPGKIATIISGSGGFGYDDIFISTDFSKYYSDLTDDERDSISHRTSGVKKFLEYLSHDNQ